jgi:hypothetical protein
MDKNEAIGELDQRRDSFRALIAELPEAAYGETWLGEWNLTQLLAHMAGWYREMTPAFQRVANGQRPTPEGVDYSDADTWNAKFSAAAKPGKAALADWDAAYAAYHAAAEDLDASLYGTDPERGRPRIGNRLLAASGIDHFNEHEEQVKKWLNSR